VLLQESGPLQALLCACGVYSMLTNSGQLSSSRTLSKFTLFRLQPKWPYCRKDTTDRLPPFFAVNEPLPILLAAIMGLQHALAMTGGIVLGPIIVASTNPNVNITQCKQLYCHVLVHY